jgi:hypothetical protein
MMVWLSGQVFLKWFSPDNNDFEFPIRAFLNDYDCRQACGHMELKRSVNSKF